MARWWAFKKPEARHLNRHRSRYVESMWSFLVFSEHLYWRYSLLNTIKVQLLGRICGIFPCSDHVRQDSVRVFLKSQCLDSWMNPILLVVTVICGVNVVVLVVSKNLHSKTGNFWLQWSISSSAVIEFLDVAIERPCKKPILDTWMVTTVSSAVIRQSWVTSWPNSPKVPTFAAKLRCLAPVGVTYADSPWRSQRLEVEYVTMHWKGEPSVPPESGNFQKISGN